MTSQNVYFIDTWIKNDPHDFDDDDYPEYQLLRGARLYEESEKKMCLRDATQQYWQQQAKGGTVIIRKCLLTEIEEYNLSEMLKLE